MKTKSLDAFFLTEEDGCHNACKISHKLMRYYGVIALKVVRMISGIEVDMTRLRHRDMLQISMKLNATPIACSFTNQ